MMKSALALVLICGTVLCAESRLNKRHFNMDHHGHGGGGDWNTHQGPPNWNHWEDSWSRPGQGGNCNFSEEQNKKIVMALYQEVLGDHNIDAADKYISATKYIQHNPLVADGLIPFKNAAREWFKDAPKEKIDFQHVTADKDLVWLHIKTTDDGKPASVMDIFRLECGKVVEHWDVLQQVPATSANSHPMF